MSTDGTFLIGRDASADIIVADETVGRKHAELVVTKGKVFLTDLSSGNGVFRLLGDGSEVRFARGWVEMSDRFAFGRFESTIAELLRQLPDTKLAELGLQGAMQVSGMGKAPPSAPLGVAVVGRTESPGKRVRCLSCGTVFLAAATSCPHCATPRAR